MESAEKKPEVKIETAQVKANKKSIKRFFTKKTALGVFIIILALLPSSYFYFKNQQTEKRLKDPDTANQQVIDAVVKKVGRHILLPTDEQPTLASVSDVSKVSDQPFFAKAQNGDKVLVYTQARKAILYRPSEDIIIEVAPLNISTTNATNSIKN